MHKEINKYIIFLLNLYTLIIQLHTGIYTLLVILYVHMDHNIVPPPLWLHSSFHIAQQFWQVCSGVDIPINV